MADSNKYNWIRTNIYRANIHFIQSGILPELSPIAGLVYLSRAAVRFDWRSYRQIFEQWG